MAHTFTSSANFLKKLRTVRTSVSDLPIDGCLVTSLCFMTKPSRGNRNGRAELRNWRADSYGICQAGEPMNERAEAEPKPVVQRGCAPL